MFPPANKNEQLRPVALKEDVAPGENLTRWLTLKK